MYMTAIDYAPYQFSFTGIGGNNTTNYLTGKMTIAVTFLAILFFVYGYLFDSTKK